MVCNYIRAAKFRIESCFHYFAVMIQEEVSHNVSAYDAEHRQQCVWVLVNRTSCGLLLSTTCERQESVGRNKIFVTSTELYLI